MNAKPARLPLLRRLGRILYVTLGVVAILLAVGLGLFRLLVGQIPAYQNELKAWVAEELGLVVDFATLDARLGLTGPELSLRGASIGGGEAGGFLQADQATITLDPYALILGRRIEISRLTLGGVRLTVERDEQGTFRLGDYAFEPDGALAGWVPQSVEVVIRDSALHFVDASRSQTWDFSDLEAVVESTDGHIEASASLKAPARLAGPITLRLVAQWPGEHDDSRRWQVDATAEALDLESLTRLIPIDSDQLLGGRADVGAHVEWSDGAFSAAQIGLEIEDLTVGETDDTNPPYEQLALTANWQRMSADSWRLALDDISVRRKGRSWAPSGSAAFSLDRDDRGIRSMRFEGDFIRLEDLDPIVRAFPGTRLAEQWARFDPEGDVHDVDLSLERRSESLTYDVSAGFEGLAVRQAGPTPGIEGVSGRFEATEDSGTIEFSSGAFRVDWPDLFPHVVDGESLTGAVVWRQGRDVVQLLSVDLAIGVLGEKARASFDLKLPRDGSSPTLELDGELPAVDLVPAKRYLPTEIMPDTVADWLEQAVTGGRAHAIELSFYGPLESFPFDDGSGQFRVAADVEGATLNYMSDWPPAEDLAGRVEFLNAGFSASGSGRALSNRSEDVVVTIPDMRRPLLTLKADTQGPLAGVVDYLRQAPLISAHLGPDFERIEVRDGVGAIDAELDLPLKDLGAFALDSSLEIADGRISIAGFGPEISEINGVIDASESTVAAQGVEAVFLGGPVTASLAPSDEIGYRAELTVDGETTAEAVAESFSLPHEDLLAGQTRWRGRLMMPALDPLATTPTRIRIESNLAGVALRFPEPLAKPPSEPSNLTVEIEFAADRRLEMTGNLGATRRFVLSFRTTESGLEFARGAIRFGGGEPSLPIQAGILVDGQLEVLQLDEWLALSGRSTLGRVGPLFLGADVDVADFHAFGQQLGATSLRVQRGTADWRIDVDSEPIAGEIVVPRDETGRAPILADMSRVYLAAAEGGDLSGVDPKTLSGLKLDAREFGIGTRQLGKVTAVVEPDPRGLVLSQFTSETPNFKTELSGSWLEGSLATRTSIDARITSSDVEAALGELGLDPVIAGESAEVTAAVYWDAAPGGDWLDHLNGEVHLSVETGSLREIDPGAGRVVGLMSIAALPRRLLLDFRDVFEEGFAFDEIGGDFKIIDGNAFTNNLRFGGPAAEIYVVGRTGLRERDYRQQIVVTSEPSNMLPTVAGLLGGPGAGAALFVFTRLFKEPLKGIGRASYCLEGSWEAPVVEPIDKDAQAKAASCAELPEEMLPAVEDD
jgi:uncharacterized protein (TIGR02099 family)